MIIDVHRHLVAAGTVQGDYIRGAQKSFAMMYRKTHNVDISDREFTQDVVRPLIDPQADNIIEEMDAAVDVQAVAQAESEAGDAEAAAAHHHGAELEGQRTAPTLTALRKKWSQDELIGYLRDPRAVQAATPRLAYMAEKYPIEMPAYPHTDEQVLRGLTSWILAH